MSQEIVLFEDNFLEIGIVIGYWGARLSTGLYGRLSDGSKYIRGNTISYSDLITRPKITKLIENLKKIETNLPADYDD